MRQEINIDKSQVPLHASTPKFQVSIAGWAQSSPISVPTMVNDIGASWISTSAGMVSLNRPWWNSSTYKLGNQVTDLSILSSTENVSPDLQPSSTI